MSGCLNDTYVSSKGVDYDVYCDVDWPGGAIADDLVHLANITELTTCINLCDSWNAQSAETADTSCVGVSVNFENPTFVGCWLKSRMSGNGVPADNQSQGYLVDSAKRVTSTSAIAPTSVAPFDLSETDLGRLPLPL